MRLLYVLLIYLVAPLVIAHEAWKALFNPEYRGRLAATARLRAASGATGIRLDSCRVGGRGAGGGRTRQRTATPVSDAADRAHHGHADRRAAGEVAVQGGRADLLPAVRPAGLRRPFPRPDVAAGGGHPRDRDLAHAVPPARTAADSAAAWQRTSFDAVRRSLPTHGLAVPRHAVARHPDRCADTGRRRPVSRDRCRTGPRAGDGQHQVRPGDSSRDGRCRSRAAAAMGRRPSGVDRRQHARR